jgi:hypothetical protein
MTNEATPFQFSEVWYALGVVTPARLAKLEAEWARGEDRSPEHYRWGAFRAFVAERRPLAPETAAALYALGAEDPDRPMGESMMHAVVDLPECPPEVVAAARASGVRHLVKAAERREPAI